MLAPTLLKAAADAVGLISYEKTLAVEAEVGAREDAVSPRLLGPRNSAL